jgi:ATP-binding cassette subfamily B protein/subfamily B ATP-binding cassette protein MsbA
MERSPVLLPRRLAHYMRPHAATLGALGAGLALISALELARPWPLKIVVDHVLGHEPLPGWIGLRPGGLLAAACLGTLGLQLALSVLRLNHNRQSIAIGQRMVNDLRSEFVAHLQRHSLRFFGSRRSADIVYRIVYDSMALQSLATNGLFPLANSVLLVGGMALVMLDIHLALALVFLGVTPLLFLVVQRLGRRVSRLAREMREAESRFLGEAQRGVEDIAVVQAFTAEPLEHQRTIQASQEALSSAGRLHVFETVYAGGVNGVIALGTAAVLYVGGKLGMAGDLSAGDLVVFVSYVSSLHAPIHALSQLASRWRTGAVSLQRVFELLDEEPEIRSAPGARAATDVRGGVHFDGVGFAYPEGSFALRDISFRTEPGMRIALVGRTGSGKSTLLRLLPRFHDPDSGRILLDGVDLRDLELGSLRACIGIVPQVPMLFPASLADNIRYGRRGASDAELWAAADRAGVSALVDDLPRGMATLVGPGGHALSQGQLQRITIARALLRNPPILILDEPTSALDPETEAYVIRSVEDAMRDRTTFVIAHRLATLRRADLVLVLEAGRIVEAGTYQTLRWAGGRFQRAHEADRLLEAPGVAP